MKFSTVSNLKSQISGLFKYISLAVLLSSGLTSCVKLDEEPSGFITAEQFYKTKADAISAANAAYFLLNSGGTTQTPYNTLFTTGMDFMTDDVDPGPGATNPDVLSQAVLNHSSTGLRVLQIWQQHYAAIKKANIAIDKIPGIADAGLDDNLKSRLAGEAKALRALYYFNLVRLFGGVPLILHDQEGVTIADFAIGRAAAGEVYGQIETDLKEAAEVLPKSYSGSDLGRITAGAAKALLAKVYLTEEKWALAVSKSEEVTGPYPYAPGASPYGYDLFDNYSQVFLPAFENGKEHIISAQFKSNSFAQGNNQSLRSVRSGVPGVAGNYAEQVRFYTQGTDKNFSIYKLFTAADKRKRGTFVTRFLGSDNKWYGDLKDKNVAGDSIPYFNKYWDPGVISNQAESGANVHIIRYAEVLLNLAEAENEANGPTDKAYAAYNRVSAWAGLTPVAGFNKNQFRESLYLDRRLELVFEYQRWFDLIRERDANGKIILEDALKKAGKVNVQVPKHLLFPIPQQEIDLNPKLTQNPGWE